MDIAKTQDIRELLEQFAKEETRLDNQTEYQSAENQQKEKEMYSEDFTEVGELYNIKCYTRAMYITSQWIENYPAKILGSSWDLNLGPYDYAIGNIIFLHSIIIIILLYYNNYNNNIYPPGSGSSSPVIL